MCNVCVLADRVNPYGYTDYSYDYKFEDVMVWMGWDAYPIREYMKNEVNLDKYDIIVLPQPSNDWISKDYDIYSYIRNKYKDIKIIHLSSINTYRLMSTTDTTLYKRWRMALEMMDVIIVNSTDEISMISKYTDSVIIRMNIPVPQYKIEYSSGNTYRNGIVACNYSKYTHGMCEYIISSEIAKKYKLPLYTVNDSTNSNWHTCISDNDILLESIPIRWTGDHMDYISSLDKCNIGIYLNMNENAGRKIIDCAIAGIPCICFDNSYVGSNLFPQTSISGESKLYECYELAHRLISDESYYNSVVNTSKIHLRSYSYSAISDVLMGIVNTLCTS